MAQVTSLLYTMVKAMKKSDVVGHRGVAGLELENTIPGFEKAIALGVKTIEFDIRETLDGQFILCHDRSLRRVSDSTVQVNSVTYATLQTISLHNNSHVPLLRDVLNLARKHKIAVIVELKTCQNPESLSRLLNEYGDLDMTVASLKSHLLDRLCKQYPQNHLPFGLCIPFYTLHRATALQASKIIVNVWLFNPLLYWLARRKKVEVFVYTVDNAWLVRHLQRLYPNILICTNHPERFIENRKANAAD